MLGSVVHRTLYQRAIREFTSDAEAYWVFTRQETVVVVLSCGRLYARDVIAEGMPVSVAVWSTASISGEVCHEHCDVLGHIAHDSAGGRENSCREGKREEEKGGGKEGEGRGRRERKMGVNINPQLGLKVLRMGHCKSSDWAGLWTGLRTQFCTHFKLLAELASQA